MLHVVYTMTIECKSYEDCYKSCPLCCQYGCNLWFACQFPQNVILVSVSWRIIIMAMTCHEKKFLIIKLPRQIKRTNKMDQVYLYCKEYPCIKCHFLLSIQWLWLNFGMEMCQVLGLNLSYVVWCILQYVYWRYTHFLFYGKMLKYYRHTVSQQQ